MTTLHPGTRRRLAAAAVALGLAGAAVLAGSAAIAATPGDSLPFASAIFKATHNSYSGNVDGAKGSIAGQLDSGVRFIEFDVHDNGYAANHDYSIGHNSPGDAVDHTGNPASSLLRDWLQTVSSWSAAHPAHAPIVVMLDLKDDLTDNPSFAEGNLTALNQELVDAFGSRLLQARDVAGALGTVGSLRGRVLSLISGDAGTRTEYRRDVGYNPAVAINARGQVVEVHDSGSGSLWYWTGAYGPDGRITWLRHGRYDSGTTPAVALNDDGQLVEVHKSQNNSGLWYRVGQLDGTGEVAWSASKQYDSGVQPTVRFTAAGTLREVHRSQSNSQNWAWTGTLNAAALTVAWAGNAKTSDSLYDKTTAVSGGSRVTVRTGTDGAAPAQTVLYATPGVATGRVRYTQTAFDEFQAGDAAVLQEGAQFYAATATNSSFIVAARQSGHSVRGWDFDSASSATSPLANYPATNHPADAWYTNLLAQNGAVA
ncbi:hypothetical protein Dvina_23585 [Dactylosporangium vinaceum]|uniref:Phosphoinositide phospholipase C, Ca2+-dependent n=1 Tax=Dactylosporangium vinaceum TaxID=53362 RepID=A0ABV5MCY0_9ACTN|nr:hypothetical protein [Dactylosporangium vinaceum]UAC00767.1 hypothetical protein Dvina_23585 [Dactylosporangium vinaceum]